MIKIPKQLFIDFFFNKHKIYDFNKIHIVMNGFTIYRWSGLDYQRNNAKKSNGAGMRIYRP